MEANDVSPPVEAPGRRLNRWTCLGIAALVLLGACFSAALAGVAYRSVHSDGHPEPVATIAVNAPEPIEGPAVDISLPAGCTLTTKQVDENGGNWWFENSSPKPVRVLIATSRLEQQPVVSADYFQHVVNVVEQAAGDRIITVDSPHAQHVGVYAGEQAGYDLYSADGGLEHAEALLLRREGDDLFIVIYGDSSNAKELKSAAQQIFNSLNVRPTPAGYDLHSA